MDISQVQTGATNAVAEWTMKQCLPCILTTNRLCYELLNRSVNQTWVNYHHRDFRNLLTSKLNEIEEKERILFERFLLQRTYNKYFVVNDPKSYTCMVLHCDGNKQTQLFNKTSDDKCVILRLMCHFAFDVPHIFILLFLNIVQCVQLLLLNSLLECSYQNATFRQFSLKFVYFEKKKVVTEAGKYYSEKLMAKGI